MSASVHQFRTDKICGSHNGIPKSKEHFHVHNVTIHMLRYGFRVILGLKIFLVTLMY